MLIVFFFWILNLFLFIIAIKLLDLYIIVLHVLRVLNGLTTRKCLISWRISFLSSLRNFFKNIHNSYKPNWASKTFQCPKTASFGLIFYITLRILWLIDKKRSNFAPLWYNALFLSSSFYMLTSHHLFHILHCIFSLNSDSIQKWKI